jgi:hypothetical protein
MTNDQNERLRAYLTGFIPLKLRGEKIETPSDFAIKDYVTNLSAKEQAKIAQGPHAATVMKNVNSALRRLQIDANKNKPIPNGRAASRFLDFEEDEVLKDTGPRKFKSDENQ